MGKCEQRRENGAEKGRKMGTVGKWLRKCEQNKEKRGNFALKGVNLGSGRQQNGGWGERMRKGVQKLGNGGLRGTKMGSEDEKWVTVGSEWGKRGKYGLGRLKMDKSGQKSKEMGE